MASLQTIEEEMRVAGAAVWPMSGLDDVARLFLAAANFARGAFDIAERVAARFADQWVGTGSRGLTGGRVLRNRLTMDNSPAPFQ